MSLDPELAAALATHPLLSQAPAPPLEGVDPLQLERKLSKLFLSGITEYYAQRLPPDSQYNVVDNLVPVEGAENVARCIFPTGKDGDANHTYPVFVWLHGGGWRNGDVEIDDPHLRTIAVDLQIAVVNVNYRHSPEHPFPTPFDDSYAGVKWVAEHASELGIDLYKGFILGGDSAGANLTAAIALKARDDPSFTGRTITGQYLREPVVVHPSAVPEKYKAEHRSFEENKAVPLFNADNVGFYLEAYIPSDGKTDTRIFPLNATSHAGLPRAFIQVMECDPLRDDGVVYEKALREAGVETKIIKYPGWIHGSHYTFPGLSTSLNIDRDERDGLRWLLGQSA